MPANTESAQTVDSSDAKLGRIYSGTTVFDGLDDVSCPADMPHSF